MPPVLVEVGCPWAQGPAYRSARPPPKPLTCAVVVLRYQRGALGAPAHPGERLIERIPGPAAGHGNQVSVQIRTSAPESGIVRPSQNLSRAPTARLRRRPLTGPGRQLRSRSHQEPGRGTNQPR